MKVGVVSSEFRAILADFRTVIAIYFLVQPHLCPLKGLMPSLLLYFLLNRLCMLDSFYRFLYS